MIYFGGDYNPAQWPSSMWKTDVSLMLSAGVNLVTIGVFDWSRLQPSPGPFDFTWLDEVFDLLGAAGIGVCLATPTASPPPWFTRLHPDELPVTADGVRLTHGSRDTYCVHSPAYRAASVAIATALADRYGSHPALRLWHVHNEYGTVCYCDRCAAAFRSWLAERYGSVAELNQAWCTDFWSQGYGTFDEVLPPRATQYLHNPGQLLDYRRFFSDALLSHYLQQREILRPTGPVTTNYALGDWVPVDHARWSRFVDVVAIDDYPTSLLERAFAADMARGWALAADCDGGWMVMEHAPGAVPSVADAAHTYVDRGAAGVMYFQWRGSPGGAEQWHPAMVPLLDSLAPLGQSLADRTPVAVSASTALMYDEEALWAWGSPHLPTRLVSYSSIARRWHSALASHVDVLPAWGDISGYSRVVVPALYLMSADTHAALRSYVAGGGTVVIGFGSGLVDEHTRTTLGSLDDLIGARITRHVWLLPDETVAVAGGLLGRTWFDELAVGSASVLLRAEDGRPVIISNRYGDGEVRYIATDLDDDPFGGVA